MPAVHAVPRMAATAPSRLNVAPWTERNLDRFTSSRRLLRIALHAAIALVAATTGSGRSARFRRAWSRQLLAILGIRLDGAEIPVAAGSLVVANHVSWLDAFVLYALLPARLPASFVAKSEARRWPLVGWLLERHGALFVTRRAGRHLLRLNESIASRLAAGEIVVVFPESTTSAGEDVLPFRSALLAPAVRAGSPVQPIAIAYGEPGGGRCAAAAFVGPQSLLDSLLAVASRPEVIAQVRLGPTHWPARAGRKALAVELRASVGALVGNLPASISPDGYCARRAPERGHGPARCSATPQR